MSSRFGQFRDNVSNRLNGVSLRDSFAGIEQSLTRIESGQDRGASQIDALERLNAICATLDRMDRRQLAEIEERRTQRDNIAGLKAQLDEVRVTREYAEVFEQKEPLVSVRIPAYKKTEELIDVAIASVLKQTYERFEIVVVNDGPNVETRNAIAALNDERITYVEFPEQNYYPTDRHLRWMVAGVPGANLAAELSKGQWIAPLDDDDEFTADHLEKLVDLALREQAELAYGALTQVHLTHQTENHIWSFPPAINHFSFMGSIYMKAIDFFQYDNESWIVDEPADWNLIRRMSRAGVKMSAIEDVVGTMYSISYTHKF